MDIAVFRTRDWKIIREIATHPRVYPHITDDCSPEACNWIPLRDESLIYLLAKEGKKVLGFCAFFPKNGITCEAHICFLPEAWGKHSVTAFKKMLAWIWANTKMRRVVGEISRDNRLAVRFALRVGAKPYGVNRKSFLKGGKLIDRIAFGISKP